MADVSWRQGVSPPTIYIEPPTGVTLSPSYTCTLQLVHQSSRRRFTWTTEDGVNPIQLDVGNNRFYVTPTITDSALIPIGLYWLVGRVSYVGNDEIYEGEGTAEVTKGYFRD